MSITHAAWRQTNKSVIFLWEKCRPGAQFSPLFYSCQCSYFNSSKEAQMRTLQPSVLQQALLASPAVILWVFWKEIIFDANPQEHLPHHFSWLFQWRKETQYLPQLKSVFLSQNLPLPTHFLLAPQPQVQLRELMMQRWLGCLPASLPFGLQAGSDPLHSGHLSSLGICQCHHLAGLPSRCSPERTAQLSTVQIQCHSLYREGSEPLGDGASATLNINSLFFPEGKFCRYP